MKDSNAKLDGEDVPRIEERNRTLLGVTKCESNASGNPMGFSKESLEKLRIKCKTS